MYVHGMKLHSFGNAEESKFVIIGKVYIFNEINM